MHGRLLGGSCQHHSVRTGCFSGRTLVTRTARVHQQELASASTATMAVWLEYLLPPPLRRLQLRRWFSSATPTRVPCNGPVWRSIDQAFVANAGANKRVFQERQAPGDGAEDWTVSFSSNCTRVSSDDLPFSSVRLTWFLNSTLA
jgi:hypothetical protein